MEIKAKIDRLIPGGKIKAIASVSLDEKYVVKNLRVVDGNKGLFVAFPQETYQDKAGKTHYSNIFFPTTNSAKYDLEDAVLNAYRQALNQGQSQDQGYSRGYDGGYHVNADLDTYMGMHM